MGVVAANGLGIADDIVLVAFAKGAEGRDVVGGGRLRMGLVDDFLGEPGR